MCFVWIWEQTAIIPLYGINLLEPELFFLILAHPVYNIWIIQEPNKSDLWYKLYFEEKKWRVYTMFKYSVLMFVE